jgi:hypothetical protein
VLPSAADQAGSTSEAADPAIAQNALTVFRMSINLTRYAGTGHPKAAD